MGFLEIVGHNVVFYLNRRGPGEDMWSFDEIMAGDADYMVNGVYGSEVTEELKEEVRKRKDW
jgi:hypothetical protein